MATALQRRNVRRGWSLSATPRPPFRNGLCRRRALASAAVATAALTSAASRPGGGSERWGGAGEGGGGTGRPAWRGERSRACALPCVRTPRSAGGRTGGLAGATCCHINTRYALQADGRTCASAGLQWGAGPLASQLAPAAAAAINEACGWAADSQQDDVTSSARCGACCSPNLTDLWGADRVSIRCLSSKLHPIPLEPAPAGDQQRPASTAALSLAAAAWMAQLGARDHTDQGRPGRSPSPAGSGSPMRWGCLMGGAAARRPPGSPRRSQALTTAAP